MIAITHKEVSQQESGIFPLYMAMKNIVILKQLVKSKILTLSFEGSYGAHFPFLQITGFGTSVGGAWAGTGVI